MRISRLTGTAIVETDRETGKSEIVLRVGPFKDRRAALRKLTEILEQTQNPKQGALVKDSENPL